MYTEDVKKEYKAAGLGTKALHFTTEGNKVITDGWAALTRAEQIDYEQKGRKLSQPGSRHSLCDVSDGQQPIVDADAATPILAQLGIFHDNHHITALSLRGVNPDQMSFNDKVVGGMGHMWLPEQPDVPEGQLQVLSSPVDVEAIKATPITVARYDSHCKEHNCKKTTSVQAWGSHVSNVAHDDGSIPKNVK